MTSTTVGGTYLSLSTSIVASVILTIFYTAMVVLLVLCLVIAVYQIKRTLKAKKQFNVIVNDKCDNSMS